MILIDFLNEVISFVQIILSSMQRIFDTLPTYLMASLFIAIIGFVIYSVFRFLVRLGRS